LSTIEAFERDLLDCGVPFAEVHALGNRYARAMETRSHVDWIELYVGIFATLRRNVNQTRSADADALERMLLIVNDDLGSQLFEEDARAELAYAGGVASRPMR
jgi:hypothetical protein